MEYLIKLEKLVGSATRVREIDVTMFTVKRGAERVPEVNELRAEIKKLGVEDLTYFEEGLDCIQYAQASRAAIVLGWTGLIDLLQTKVVGPDLATLNANLNVWFHGIARKISRVQTIDDLIKHFDDSLLLEVGRKLGYFQSHAFTQLNAMRDERNNCAHVQEYAVTPRIALGFYAKLIAYLPLVL